MTTYTKGLPGELPEIRDFINMVFSMHKAPHNFQRLLPKLYADTAFSEGFHYLAKEDGRIRAVVCALPFSLRSGDQTLSCASIGSVSVHPYSRGKGYMKELMEWVQRDLREQGVELGVLDGKRQRYQYFGYEPGGQKLEFQLVSDNFRHCAKDFTNFPLTFQPVTPEDTGLIAHCLRLHQNQTLHSLRTEENFLSICSSWNCRLYAVQNNGEVWGYFCAADHQILELVLEKEEALFSTLRTFMEANHLDRMTFACPSWNPERARLLSSFCERFLVSPEENFCIFQPQAVLSFFLHLKARNLPLTKASLVINPGDDTPLRITVEDAGIWVKTAPDHSGIPLTLPDMVRFLCSPGCILPGQMPAGLSSVNWFPLPLSLSPVDKC